MLKKQNITKICIQKLFVTRSWPPAVSKVLMLMYQYCGSLEFRGVSAQSPGNVAIWPIAQCSQCLSWGKREREGEREGERGKKIEKMGQTKWSTLLRVSSGASLNGLTEVYKKVP